MPKSSRDKRSQTKDISNNPYSKDRRPPQNNDDDDTAPAPTFDSMNLKPALLRGIYAYGFERPSAIQQRAVRPIIRGRDVIAQSQVSYDNYIILFPFTFI